MEQYSATSVLLLTRDILAHLVARFMQFFAVCAYSRGCALLTIAPPALELVLIRKSHQLKLVQKATKNWQSRVKKSY